ncbi:MAG: hypothetical protein HQK53_15495 [Oligoflexia bacterium]|nr:hypothetical protein [Oligoflexia bacterium]
MTMISTIKTMSVQIAKTCIVTTISLCSCGINLSAAIHIPDAPDAHSYPHSHLSMQSSDESCIVPVADFLKVDLEKNIMFFSQEYIDFYREQYNMNIVTEGDQGKHWDEIIANDLIGNTEGFSITEPYFKYSGVYYPLSFKSDPKALSKFFGFGTSKCIKSVGHRGLKFSADKIWTVRLDSSGKAYLERRTAIISKLTFIIKNFDETRKKIAEIKRIEEEEKAAQQRIAEEKAAAMVKKVAKKTDPFKIGTMVHCDSLNYTYVIVGINQNNNVSIYARDRRIADRRIIEVSRKRLTLVDPFSAAF